MTDRGRPLWPQPRCSEQPRAPPRRSSVPSRLTPWLSAPRSGIPSSLAVALAAPLWRTCSPPQVAALPPRRPSASCSSNGGGLQFHTHVLNTAGTVVHFHAKGSTQINDTIYQHVKSRYRTVLKQAADAPAAPDEYTGGPCYTLGGRGNLWGLYIPRVDKATLEEFFPRSVCEELRETYYCQAECLLKNRPYPDERPSEPLSGDPYGSLNEHDQEASDNYKLARRVRAALEAELKRFEQQVIFAPGWRVRFGKLDWSLLAAQFNSDIKKDEAIYQFPQGAYSPVDAVLQQALARCVDAADGLDPNAAAGAGHNAGELTTLIGCEVMRLGFDDSKKSTNKEATHAIIRDRQGALHELRAKQFVLSAGTVDSAAILLRSAHVRDRSTEEPVKRVYGYTDHNIYGGI